MSSGYNSALGFYTTDPDEVREAIGVPRFGGAAGTEWDFVFNGMIFQGGVFTAINPNAVLSFHVPFTQQVLGIFLEPITTAGPVTLAGAPSLQGVTINNAGASGTIYWFAVGV